MYTRGAIRDTQCNRNYIIYYLPTIFGMLPYTYLLKQMSSAYRHLRHQQFAKLFFGHTALFGHGTYVLPNIPNAGLVDVVDQLGHYMPCTIHTQFPSKNSEVVVRDIYDHVQQTRSENPYETTVVLMHWQPKITMQCMERLSKERAFITLGIHRHEKEFFRASDADMEIAFQLYRPVGMSDIMYNAWRDQIYPARCIGLVQQTAHECTRALNLALGLTQDRLKLSTMDRVKTQQDIWSEFIGNDDEP